MNICLIMTMMTRTTAYYVGSRRRHLFLSWATDRGRRCGTAAANDVDELSASVEWWT